MAKRGAPKGNKNGARGRIWSDVLRRLLLRDREKLQALANALIKKAASGDVSALKEIGDRLEGKIPQAIEATGADGAPLMTPVINFYRESRPD